MAFEYGVAQLVSIPCYAGETPTAPVNPVATVSVDDGAFGPADNAPSVVGTGVRLLLSVAEATASVVTVNVASDNLEDQTATFYFEGNYTAARATAITTIAGDVVNLDGASVADIQSGLGLTGEAATAVIGLSTFDPASDEVDVGAVAGVAVASVADFKATGFAVAGDEMDMVDAPNATALIAVGVAVWISTTRTLTSFGTLAADVATAVWAAGSRTLTSFGALVADTAAATAIAVWAAGSRTLTSFGTLVASMATAVWGAVTRTLTASPAGGALEATLTAMKGAGWTDETLVAITEAIEAIDPGGAYVVTRTFEDSDGNAVGDLKITVQGDAAGVADGTVVAKFPTSATGNVTFNLDAGVYHVLSPSTAILAASDTTLTVSGNSTGTITLSALSLPTPSSPDNYTLLYYARDEEGNGVGAGEVTVQVAQVYPPQDAALDFMYAAEENSHTSDANGVVGWECPKTVQQEALIITRTMADDSERVDRIQIIIDAAKADAQDRINIADLEIQWAR